MTIVMPPCVPSRRTIGATIADTLQRVAKVLRWGKGKTIVTAGELNASHLGKKYRVKMGEHYYQGTLNTVSHSHVVGTGIYFRNDDGVAWVFDTAPDTEIEEVL